MGLLDAAALIDVIANANDIGSHALLRRYERARKADNALMLHFVDGIKNLFSRSSLYVSSLRKAGLSFTDKNQFIKNFFMEYASGVRADLPSLALMQGE
jgi:2-polyprenyl-6-methoxyphenol hydroxylase-like FAD-dependent oxidoreductase